MSDPIAWGSLTFGGRLRVAREGQGWSLARLAREAGTCKSYVHALEKGRHTPSAETLLTLSQLFGLTMGELYVGRMGT